MKIICKWVFKEKVQGIQTPQLKTKYRNIENMSGDELINMITTLLAQSETERLIIEKEGKSLQTMTDIVGNHIKKVDYFKWEIEN